MINELRYFSHIWSTVPTWKRRTRWRRRFALYKEDCTRRRIVDNGGVFVSPCLLVFFACFPVLAHANGEAVLNSRGMYHTLCATSCFFHTLNDRHSTRLNARACRCIVPRLPVNGKLRCVSESTVQTFFYVFPAIPFTTRLANPNVVFYANTWDWLYVRCQQVLLLAGILLMYRDHASCILDLAFPQLENQSCVIFDVPGIIV